MASNKVFLGVIAVLAVVVAGFAIALNEQQQVISQGFTGSNKIITSSSPYQGSWGGVLAQQSSVQDNTLFITGSSTVSSDPDKVTVYFSVQKTDLSAKVSQQVNADKVAAVKAALTAKGIPAGDIETTSYTLNEIREYDYNTQGYTYAGFQTTHSMKVELTDMSKAGEIIDAAVGAGANGVSVAFGLSDGKMDTLRTQALKAAGENARSNADAVAEGIGVTIKRVMSASEGYSYIPLAYSSYDVKAESAGAAPAATDITPGSISVTASVNVVYEI